MIPGDSVSFWHLYNLWISPSVLQRERGGGRCLGNNRMLQKICLFYSKKRIRIRCWLLMRFKSKYYLNKGGDHLVFTEQLSWCFGGENFLLSVSQGWWCQKNVCSRFTAAFKERVLTTASEAFIHVLPKPGRYKSQQEQLGQHKIRMYLANSGKNSSPCANGQRKSENYEN